MAWNVFKFCTGLKVVGSVMIVVVLAVVGVSYYAVVISIYAPQVIKGGSEAAVALIVVILFHVLLLMLLWCYFTVVFTDPGGVPQNWRPSPIEDLEDQTTALASTITPATGLNMPTVAQGPLVRYCRKCSQFKPPRCHHCSVCGRCVLKMDHHCVWVVNCVGARNYKFFLLFLLYTFLETTLVTAALLPQFIAFLSDVEEEAVHPGTLATMFLAFDPCFYRRENTYWVEFVLIHACTTELVFLALGTVLNLAFALSVLGFLIMHMSLVAGNTTTIEAYEKKASTRWRFDLGHKKNFEQVFGTRKLYWVLPMYTQEDQKKMTVLHGLDYPLRPDLES